MRRALGAVGYRPAIPTLIDLLLAQTGMLRGCAAWSLGALGATQARHPLQEALAREAHPYAQERMRVALEEIGVG